MNQMCCPFFVVLLVLTGCALTMPPPAGLNLKPARARGESQQNAPLSITPTDVSKEPPPNLRLRSRMMAALNSNDTGKKNLLPPATQTLILTKNRKSKKSSARPFFGAVTESPITAKPQTRPNPTRPNPRELPSSANYGVNSVLQTNFVDSQGRVLKNVVSIPIRVGSAQFKQVSSSVASAALVEGEAEKKVRVKFEPAPSPTRS
ncbi:hypothetical protein KIN20_015724 [Parelaphostrongylus tenuis]|uniref:Uncharacterized protein n=1 Tax=Parelaphostrongylus tenuis TaxID=148309 RepID=A0AAD5QMF9_PARTN|nr:hypothetical protein KIN20_015724 [Parelaphostrongylus tenuis]